MRTYLIDENKNEIIIDLTKTIRHSSELVEFEYSVVEDCQLRNQKRIFVRKLARAYFVSEDGKTWKKLARQDLPRVILNIDTVYKVYRGHKPSGLSDDSGGNVVTQMPGKIIKIMTAIGERVEKGVPIIIIEAMKMENEIKSNINGIISAIHVKEGQNLDQGILMIEIEEEKL